MRELVEFRIPEEHAARYLKRGEGILLGGSVRKLSVDTGSKRFEDIGEIDRKLREEGTCFFTSWSIRRTYSKSELHGARLFKLAIVRTFEPPGEKCGTIYDESTACSLCGAGAQQVGPLLLPLSRIPRKRDIAQTISGEVIVSGRFRSVVEQQGVRGLAFGPVLDSRRHTIAQDWYQCRLSNHDLEIVPPTQVGVDPFDMDDAGRFRCPRGHVLGLNLISELWVRCREMPTDDFLATRQFIGTRRGLLRPSRLFLASSAAKELMDRERVLGLRFENAHCD